MCLEDMGVRDAADDGVDKTGVRQLINNRKGKKSVTM